VLNKSLVLGVDGTRIGKIVDLLFDDKGRILLVVVAKLNIPFINVGLVRLFIPFPLLMKLDSKYVLTVPLSGLRQFRRFYISKDIVSEIDRIEDKCRWLDLLLILLLVLIISLIVVLSIVYRGIGSIIVLIAIGLSVTSPILIKDLLEVHIYGLHSLQSMLGSKVYDRWGVLVGFITNVDLDIDKGVIRRVYVKKPILASSNVIKELFSSGNLLKIPVTFIKSAKRGRVILNITLNELHEAIIEKAH